MSTLNEESEATPSRRWRLSWRHLPLLVILLLAAFLRLWQLDSLPPGLYHDEAYNGLDALSLIEGDTFPIFYEGWELYAEEAHADRPIQETQLPIFFEGNFGREPLHVYLMAISVYLFGATPFAIRLVPALAGVAAVLTTYLAAGALLENVERVFRREEEIPAANLRSFVTLLAAFVMAVLYPALTFSRFGVRAMLFVPVETLAVYCFWRGINQVAGRQRQHAEGQNLFTQDPIPVDTFAPRWFAAAGFWLGFSLYTYAAARLLPFLFVAFVLLWLWRDRTVWQRYWVNLAIMGGVSFIVALPLLLFFIRYPYFFVFRSRYVANRGAGTYPGQPWRTWLFNVGRVLRGLIWQGETNLRHNLPGRPYLDPIQTLFAGLGTVAIIVHRLQLRHLFLLLWAGIMIAPSILSGDAPHFGRMIGAAPPLAILIALGAGWFWREVGLRQLSATDDTVYSRRPAIVMVLVMLLFLVSATLATRDYFGRYQAQPELAEHFYVDDWQLGQYAAELPDEATIYLTPTQEQMATIYFALSGEIDRLRSYYSPEGLIPAGHPGEPLVYLVRPLAAETLPRLAAFFPSAETVSTEAEFIPLHVPPEAERVPAQQMPQDIIWGGAIRLVGWSTLQEGDFLFVTLFWHSEVEVERQYTAFVHLLQQDGETLLAQLDRPPEGYPTSDWVPGEVVIDTYTIILPEERQPGPYLLQSGFYHLPTDERLGSPQLLGEIVINP